MSGANGICFICVRECIHDEISLDTVVHNDEHNITEVKYVFPELAFLLAASIPAYICCSCRTTLHSFYMFKKRCLENYGRLIRNTNILQGVGQAVSATETAREPGVKLEPDVHMELVSEEEHEDSLLVSEQPDNHTIRAEQAPEPEHSVHQHSYRPLEFIKCETDLGNEQEGGFISEGEDQMQDDTQEDALSLYNITEQTQNEQHETLLPEKSKHLYEKVYISFKHWCRTKNVTNISENILLVFFHEQARNKKASSLWATYSMLKSTISLKENIDISKYFKLLAFLKHKNISYKPKKSSVFSKEEINKFVTEAPDEAFLSTKAVFVIGVAGACRTDELCNMHVRDIDIRDDIIIINIPKSKDGSSRKFVLVEPYWIEIVKKYLSMRPNPDMPKVFIGFRQGKPTRQNIGHNTISKVPRTVATYLKLNNLDNYTGHSLRRTSAIILAKSGGIVRTTI